MMPNGAWLENEMEGAIASDMQLRLMKTPVISAIRDVLPDKSVKDDAELSALVTYIDKSVERRGRCAYGRYGVRHRV